MSVSDFKLMMNARCLSCQGDGEFDKPTRRGLCNACYLRERRAGNLEKYPTGYFLAEPYQHMLWSVQHFPEQVRALLEKFDRGEL